MNTARTAPRWVLAALITTALCSVNWAQAPTTAQLRLAIERQADWWFPRSIDSLQGGFIETYDLDGQPQRDEVRTLVFQCRQVWLASTLAQALPNRAPAMRQHVEHGLRYIRDRFGDAQHGGLFWARTLDGGPTPRFGDQKHAYSLSFVIYAGATAHRAAPDAGGLALAQQTFAWLDAHAHDGRHGGYHEAYDRDGRPCLQPKGPGPQRFDALGTLYGFKSMNTHIHLLEAFTALYRAWPDPHLRQRLAELDDIVRHRIYVEPGCLNLYFTRDWRAMPDHASFGHDVETAFLLTESAHALGLDDATSSVQPKRLVDHALEFGWDTTHGGFFDVGAAFRKPKVEPKTWWVQAEGLHVLALMHRRYPDQPLYAQRLAEQWRFIADHQIDPADGAWFASVNADGSRIPDAPKAHRWKAGYHTVRALVESLRLLESPLDLGDAAASTP